MCAGNPEEDRPQERGTADADKRESGNIRGNARRNTDRDAEKKRHPNPNAAVVMNITTTPQTMTGATETILPVNPARMMTE